MELKQNHKNSMSSCHPITAVMLEYIIRRRKSAAGDEDGRHFDGIFAYTV